MRHILDDDAFSALVDQLHEMADLAAEDAEPAREARCLAALAHISGAYVQERTGLFVDVPDEHVEIVKEAIAEVEDEEAIEITSDTFTWEDRS